MGVDSMRDGMPQGHDLGDSFAQHHVREPVRTDSSQCEASTDVSCDLSAETMNAKQVLIVAAYDEYCGRVSRGEQIDLVAYFSRHESICAELQQIIAEQGVLLRHASLMGECVDAKWPKLGDTLRSLSLISELGSGGFSRVYLARYESLGGRQIVVKVHRASSREAEILGNLLHENIVPVHFAEHEVATGFSLLCMPFLGRATLRHVLRRLWKDGRRPKQAREVLDAIRAEHMPGDESADRMEVNPSLQLGSYVTAIMTIMLQIVEAVAYAHRSGVLHLDLKPSNVLLTESGSAKVLDFNLAMNRSGQHMRLGGTPPYMSPEQTKCYLRGESAATVDQRSDIYSLGVLMYELLYGQRPFGYQEQAPLTSASLIGHLDEQRRTAIVFPGRESGVNRRLARIVKRCLALEPAQRYRSADDLAAALRRELTLAGRVRRWAALRRQPLLGVTALLLASCLAATCFTPKVVPYPVREYRQAVACQAEGDYPQSIVHLTNYLNAEPDQPFAILRRACAYAETGDFLDAMGDLKKYTNRSGRREWMAFSAYVLQRMKLHNEAIAEYESLLALGYKTASVYNNLGRAYLSRAKLTSALVALNSALELDPQCVVAMWNRANVQMAFAVQAFDFPTLAIRDIETTMAMADDPSGYYFTADQIYKHAAFLDPRYLPEAKKYRRLAEEVAQSERSKTPEPDGSPAPRALMPPQPPSLLNPIKGLFETADHSERRL